MGLFASPGVGAGPPDEATGVIPVEVRVREAPFRTVRLGGGLRFDQARNEVRLVSEWTNRNFLGGMRKLTIHAEVGWAFIPDIYAVATNDESVGPRDGPIARVSLELEQPRFLGHPSLRAAQPAHLRSHARADLRRRRDGVHHGRRLAAGVDG